jgi:hypothetical protein
MTKQRDELDNSEKRQLTAAIGGGHPASIVLIDVASSLLRSDRELLGMLKRSPEPSAQSDGLSRTPPVGKDEHRVVGRRFILTNIGISRTLGRHLPGIRRTTNLPWLLIPEYHT